MKGLNQLSLLYVEDEPYLREHVAFCLKLHLGRVDTANNGLEGLELARKLRPDLVMTDVCMPVMDGLELASALHREFADMPVIVCTAFTDTAYLIRCIELGIRAFVPKPIDLDHLLEVIGETGRPIIQERELERLKLESVRNGCCFLGNGPAMNAIAGQIAQLAGSDYSILINGEPGSGKTSTARLIHSISRRHGRPLLMIESQGRPADQLEAELFGPPPGRGRPSATQSHGLLAAADGATLLIDAPEHLPLPLQARLLRVIEDKRCTPTGSASSIPCDLRILATTCADLSAEVRAGRFRQDLLLNIADHQITLPTLRERPEDLEALALRFLSEASDDLGLTRPVLPPESLELLKAHDWPGNCRELRQVLRRSLLVSRTAISPATVKSLLKRPAADTVAGPKGFQSLNLADLEKWAVSEALIATGGRKMEAARTLGISYNSFKDKLRRYGLQQ